MELSARDCLAYSRLTSKEKIYWYTGTNRLRVSAITSIPRLRDVPLQGLSIYYVIRNDFAFCCKFEKMSQIHVFRGVRPDYYDITQGGLSKFINLLQYYIGEVLEVYYNITVLKGKWKVIILFSFTLSKIHHFILVNVDL